MAYFLTELKEGLTISFGAIRANKMRSILTTLGVIIGIVSVTLMATAIEGVNRAFKKSAEAAGTDVLYIQKFPWFFTDDWSTIRNRRMLKVSYAARIERQSMFATAVAPVVGTGRRVTYGDNSMEGAFISGTTSQYLATAGVTLGDGRFFTADEAASGHPVCVVGAAVVENLFPRSDPIGKTIRVSGFPYSIIGTMEKQGGFFAFGSFMADTRVFVPLVRFENQFGDRRDVTIQVKVADLKQLDDAKLEIEGIMRTIRGLMPGKTNDFNINQQEMLTQAFAPIGLAIASIGLLITGLSLFVGGIGIMNIMFVSVTERTREIGIRKAIGAKRSTILIQFLSEAAALCLIGGFSGLAIAFPLSLIVDQFIPTAMPLPVVFISMGISLVVGLISGFLPAYRAAKMDPVEALRYE
jgi:putative ABC transport system permease protein